MHDTSEPALERYYELLRDRTPLARLTCASMGATSLPDSSLASSSMPADVGENAIDIALKVASAHLRRG